MSEPGSALRRGRNSRGRASPASFGLVRVDADFEDEYPGADRTCTEAYASLCRTGETLLGKLDRRVRVTFGIGQAAVTALAVIDGAGVPLTPSQVSDLVLIASATIRAARTGHRRPLLRHRRRPLLLRGQPGVRAAVPVRRGGHGRPGRDGPPRYSPIWAFDRPGEKRTFEELVDFITKRRALCPGLHVYHYNHYEPTSVDHLTELHGTRQEAVGRLMGRFATREDEVDDLFRLGVFVDLYRVIRQGVQAGVESYSIKRLEPLCGYDRQVDLREATASLIEFEAALEDGTAAGDAGRQRVVAGYNEDDCRATLALRDWLEDRRRDLAERTGEQLPRPFVDEPVRAPEDPEVTRIRSALLAGVPASADGRTEEQRARGLLADLLDWHRREDKPAWRRYFYVRTLSPPS
jgi:RNase_H superfamily